MPGWEIKSIHCAGLPGLSALLSRLPWTPESLNPNSSLRMECIPFALWSGNVGSCNSKGAYCLVLVVQFVDQVVCNVIEKHRGTLLRCIYCICCHKGWQMQDE